MENTTLPRNLTAPRNQNLLWSRLNMFSVVTYSLFFVLGTTGNALVIFITLFRMKKTVHTIWIMSLAVADFTCSFFMLFNIAYQALGFHWPFGRIMCKLQDTIIFFNLFASIYLLMVISVDRCIAVWHPVWARNHRTPRLASFVVLCLSILALVLCSSHLHFKETYNDANGTKIKCSSSYRKIDKGGSVYCAVILIRFIFGFIIPFTVIVVCYGAIVVRLRRDGLSQSSRPFKVITAVIVAFFVCWFPFHIFHFLKVKAFYEPRMPKEVSIGLQLSYCLAYFNSCLNPILYFFMGRNFKEKLRCSLLSAVENAFTEESNQTSTSCRTGVTTSEF